MSTPSSFVELFARAAIASIFATIEPECGPVSARYVQAKRAVTETANDYVTDHGDAVDIPEYLELKARLWRVADGEVADSALVELLANANARRELLFDRFEICAEPGDADYPKHKARWLDYLSVEMSRCVGDMIYSRFHHGSNA